jgi:hypothetical protein
MAKDRDQRYADAFEFRKALTLAAERAFGTTQQAILSESPLDLPLEPPANEQKPEAPPLMAAGAGGGWGGFSDLETRARAPAPTRGPSVPLAVGASKDRVSAAKPMVSKAPAHSAGPRLLDPEPASSSAGVAMAEGDGLQVAHDDALFGDNPLDTFAGAGAGRLELDLSGGALPRVAQPGGNRVSRAESLRTPVAKPARVARSTPSAAFWALPLLLLVGFVLLLLSPSLFSLPLPDASAALRREEENPALRDGRPFREIGARPKVGSAAPALRDVTF